jgi:transketolase
MNPVDYSSLRKVANEIRKMCLDLAFEKNPKPTHLGGALSTIEILTALYFCVMRYDVSNPLWEDRDRFFLSKGHSILGYYSALCKAGFFSIQDLYTYGTDCTSLPGHPVKKKEFGIEFTNGSLGMGLAVGIGHAIAAKRQSRDYRVFVLMGDGETNEGSVWEAAMAAPNFNLNNLVAIIDNNGYQQTGKTAEIIRNDNLANKFECFGWDVVTIDGHSLEEIIGAIQRDSNGKPKMIIARTVKGKGFTFSAANNAWHHGVMTKEMYMIGSKELEQNND